MAEHKLETAKEEIAAQQVTLVHNPFHTKPTEDAKAALEKMFKGNTLSLVCTIQGVRVLQADFIASAYPSWSKEDERLALKRDEDFVIVKMPRGDETKNVPVAPASRYGISRSLLEKIRKEGYKPGDLPDIEKYVKEHRDVLEIYIARPVDCISMVNRTLSASGARRIDVQKPGYALDTALQQPGMAVTWVGQRQNVETFGAINVTTGKVEEKPLPASSLQTEEPAGPEQVKAVLADAKAGDVVFFLREISAETIGDVRAKEKKGDKVVWLDASGKRVDVSALKDDEKLHDAPAVPFAVSHTGVYGGADKKTGQPLVGQAHIFIGTISNDNLVRTLSRNAKNWHAVAVISHDFFSKAVPSSIVLGATPERSDF